MSTKDRDPSVGLTRRQFVRGAGATGALALAQASHAASEEKDKKASAGKGPASKLPTRVLGKTGLRVSTVCYGSYNLSNPKLLDNALNGGMTLVVTANDYQNGTAERAIGSVMARRRKDVVLCTGKECKTDTTAGELATEIDRSLERLQTDHVDLWRVHHVNDARVLKNDAIYEAFDKAKKAGKVRHLGLSTHSAPENGAVIEAAVASKRFEFLMCRYNFMEFPKDHVPFTKAAKAGMGVIVFKVRAGRRNEASAEMDRLQKELNVSAEQASIKWALQNKNVSSVVSGARSFEGIREACEAAQGRLSRAERRYLDAYVKRFDHEFCRFCGQCQAACPYGVQIDDVMRFAMYFKYYGAEKAAMAEYATLPASKQAHYCAQCSGDCMSACPHEVCVQEQLVEAHQLLSLETGTHHYA